MFASGAPFQDYDSGLGNGRVLLGLETLVVERWSTTKRSREGTVGYWNGYIDYGARGQDLVKY